MKPTGQLQSKYNRLTLLSEPFSIMKSGTMRKYVSAKCDHGLWRHPLYRVWSGILDRCYNKKKKEYPGYGGRGISVCDEWRNNFKAFYDFAMANGWKKGLETDRENNNGNYEPDNVRFVTHFENCQNTRAIKLKFHQVLTIRNLAKMGAFTKTEIAQIYGIGRNTVRKYCIAN